MSDNNDKVFRFFGIIPWIILGAAAFAGFAFLFGFVVMLLWNWLMPFLFGLPELTYWQAWGILILAQILFKGPMHGMNKPRHRRERFDNEWKQKFRSKFSNGFMGENIRMENKENE